MKKYIFSLLIFGVAISNANGFSPSMQSYIDTLKMEAKKSNVGFTDFNAKRGEQIFTSKHIGKKGNLISCTSCHGSNLTKNGKNATTNKIIKPLAPSVNKSRLTDTKEVQKWLRRNFKDVYNREGTALEKGDVLYYIQSK
jgi:cytochrome c553